MRASPSYVGAFEYCPRKFEYRYVKGIRYQTQWSIKGGAMHEALKVYYTTKMDKGETVPTDGILEVFLEAVSRRLSAPGREEHGEPLWFDGESPVEVLRDGAAQLGVYLERVAPGITPIAVEEPLSMPLPSGVEVRGYIDLVDDELRIHDQKFPEDLPRGESLLSEWQPVIYSALWHHQTGEWPRAFVLDVVARGRAQKPKPVVARIEMPITEKLVQSRLSDFAWITETMSEARRTGNYPRRPSQIHCGKCVYKVPCWNGLAELSSRPTFEPAGEEVPA
jgi:CRISPR/Cas system-associated exonuclease Cas4 (RecB family)